jgi:hypothetical protein
MQVLEIVHEDYFSFSLGQVEEVGAVRDPEIHTDNGGICGIKVRS